MTPPPPPPTLLMTVHFRKCEINLVVRTVVQQMFLNKEELCRTTGAHFMNDDNKEIKVVKYGDGARVTI